MIKKQNSRLAYGKVNRVCKKEKKRTCNIIIIYNKFINIFLFVYSQLDKARPIKLKFFHAFMLSYGRFLDVNQGT